MLAGANPARLKYSYIRHTGYQLLSMRAPPGLPSSSRAVPVFFDSLISWRFFQGFQNGIRRQKARRRTAGKER